MDLNYLHFRQQIELMRASTATCDSARYAHEELAAAYSRRIADHLRQQRSHVGA